MKSAGKARNDGLYRHIRTSKEIIRNLLNDYIKNTWNLFYRPFFKGLGKDTVQSCVVSMAASDGMKSLYRKVVFY